MTQGFVFCLVCLSHLFLKDGCPDEMQLSESILLQPHLFSLHTSLL